MYGPYGTITNFSGGYIRSEITIKDDESKPTVSIESIETVYETNPFSRPVDMVLSGPTNEDLEIRLRFEGTATDGKDYRIVGAENNGTFIIPAGSRSLSPLRVGLALRAWRYLPAGGGGAGDPYQARTQG